MMRLTPCKIVFVGIFVQCLLSCPAFASSFTDLKTCLIAPIEFASPKQALSVLLLNDTDEDIVLERGRDDISFHIKKYDKTLKQFLISHFIWSATTCGGAGKILVPAHGHATVAYEASDLVDEPGVYIIEIGLGLDSVSPSESMHIASFHTTTSRMDLWGQRGPRRE